MTQKLVWRLKEMPTSENLRELVKDGILSKEEAREILFSLETEEDRDKKSLESEIKFLRELVEKLAKRSEIITTIREVETPYRKYPWYNPYVIWSAGDMPLTSNNPLAIYTTGTITTDSNNFSSIKTF